MAIDKPTDVLQMISCGLFQAGEFLAHSGAVLPFKIECDALSEAQIDLFADLALRLRPGKRYSRIIGVPRGGLRLAEAIRRRNIDGVDTKAPVLIVDDVLTTGQSMVQIAASETMAQMAASENNGCQGVVIFARGPCPFWVKPIFLLNEALHD